MNIHKAYMQQLTEYANAHQLRLKPDTSALQTKQSQQQQPPPQVGQAEGLFAHHPALTPPAKEATKERKRRHSTIAKRLGALAKALADSSPLDINPPATRCGGFCTQRHPENNPQLPCLQTCGHRASAKMIGCPRCGGCAPQDNSPARHVLHCHCTCEATKQARQAASRPPPKTLLDCFLEGAGPLPHRPSSPPPQQGPPSPLLPPRRAQPRPTSPEHRKRQNISPPPLPPAPNLPHCLVDWHIKARRKGQASGKVTSQHYDPTTQTHICTITIQMAPPKPGPAMKPSKLQAPPRPQHPHRWNQNDLNTPYKAHLIRLREAHRCGLNTP